MEQAEEDEHVDEQVGPAPDPDRVRRVVGELGCSASAIPSAPSPIRTTRSHTIDRTRSAYTRNASSVTAMTTSFSSISPRPASDRLPEDVDAVEHRLALRQRVPAVHHRHRHLAVAQAWRRDLRDQLRRGAIRFWVMSSCARGAVNTRSPLWASVRRRPVVRLRVRRRRAAGRSRLSSGCGAGAVVEEARAEARPRSVLGSGASRACPSTSLDLVLAVGVEGDHPAHRRRRPGVARSRSAARPPGRGCTGWRTTATPDGAARVGAGVGGAVVDHDDR